MMQTTFSQICNLYISSGRYLHPWRDIHRRNCNFTIELTPCHLAASYYTFNRSSCPHLNIHVLAVGNLGCIQCLCNFKTLRELMWWTINDDDLKECYSSSLTQQSNMWFHHWICHFLFQTYVCYQMKVNTAGNFKQRELPSFCYIHCMFGHPCKLTSIPPGTDKYTVHSQRGQSTP